jgi:DNA polymerase III delta prime subunit
MYTQAIAERWGEITQEGVIEIVQEMGLEEPIVELVECSLSGQLGNARSILEGLMITSGYSGGELLEIISKVVKEREDVDQVEFALILSEIDCNLSKEANSIIHLTNFLTKLGSLG